MELRSVILYAVEFRGMILSVFRCIFIFLTISNAGFLVLSLSELTAIKEHDREVTRQAVRAQDEVNIQ